MSRYEKLIYQQNSFASNLALSFLVFNTIQTIVTLNSIDMVATGIRTLEIILFNILLSFLAFIAVAAIKGYSKLWAYLTLALGFLQFLRPFFMPNSVNNFSRWVIILNLVLGGIVLVVSGLVSVVKNRHYQQALQEST